MTFTTTAQSFPVQGVPLSSDVAVIQLGFETSLLARGTLALSYDANLSSRVEDHTLRAVLEWAL